MSVKSLAAGCFCLLLFLSGCSQLETPKTEPFYAETKPPQKKEFRWSNGKMPKSFDPALASAAPETDVVRAVYEGLTDADPKTLQPVPAIAAEWKASEDHKIWTFNLRKDARWSNGERVTAKDFVRSWKRLAAMSEKLPHRELLQNIVGLESGTVIISAPVEAEETDLLSRPGFDSGESPFGNRSDSDSAINPPPVASPTVAQEVPTEPLPNERKTITTNFGVEAVDNFTLKVSLVKPDKDFPALVAHPVFRPIYGDGKTFETNKLNADIVTNGAFRVFSIGQDGVTLDRSETYWNREAVELERVRFVPTESAEKALAAYRAGEVDAVTNADFEPLALKLLTPYEDFRRTTHSALNFYEFNSKKPPFDDRRVREALAIAVERERLTEDEMDGASLPALSFLPFEKAAETKLVEDAQRAKNLLTESGFPNGANFPTVKLLINRNNVQQRIARSVAKMWKRNLNIETEIVVIDSSELAAAWATDEYALLRRGAVLPTADETINIMAIFAVQSSAQNVAAVVENSPANGNPNANSSVSTTEPPKAEDEMPVSEENSMRATPEEETILTEEQALDRLPAIPLYFPTSYSLVKPYIQGFDTNILDAPSLKTVRINNNWQPQTTKKES